jgi:hypothetical protein
VKRKHGTDKDVRQRTTIVFAGVAIGDDPFFQTIGCAFVDEAGVQQERGDFVRREERSGHASPLCLKRTWGFGFTRAFGMAEPRFGNFSGGHTPERSEFRWEVADGREPSNLPEYGGKFFPLLEDVQQVAREGRAGAEDGFGRQRVVRIAAEHRQSLSGFRSRFLFFFFALGVLRLLVFQGELLVLVPGCVRAAHEACRKFGAASI